MKNPSGDAQKGLAQGADQDESPKRHLTSIFTASGVLIAIALGTYVKATTVTSKPAKASQTGELKSAAVIVNDFQNPFFVQIARGAESKAREINRNVKFTLVKSDLYDRADQVNSLVSSGVDLILLAADTTHIAPVLKRAKSAGVTVVAVEVGVKQGSTPQ